MQVTATFDILDQGGNARDQLVLELTLDEMPSRGAMWLHDQLDAAVRSGTPCTLCFSRRLGEAQADDGLCLVNTRLVLRPVEVVLSIAPPGPSG